MAVKSSNVNLLFEIGVEEIPSEYFETAVESIKRKAPALLDECGYQFDQLEIHTTPRRLVLFAENFVKKSEVIEEKLGPSKEQSYQNEAPTQALLGFLKSLGKTEADLKWKETPKGVRACVSVRKEMKPIKHFFETLPLQIEFPKLMRWDATNYKFTRPIRWTFALIGNKPQKYKIASVTSNSYTYGHRFLANKKIRVAKADLALFEDALCRHHVILRESERIKLVRASVAKFHNQDEVLVKQVANLVEEPYPVIGKFNQEYLKLPEQVLSTCMRKHQKIFACYDSSGKMVNKFVAIINGRRKDPKLIARNFENVLVSRLEDAKFFYHEDMKTSLLSKATKLKDLVFLGSLGSYLDKTQRIERLGELIISRSSRSGDRSLPTALKAAATLSKADLTTHLVYEFPELQGVAGREYARSEGMEDEIARSIYDHYLPKSLSESFESIRSSVSFLGGVIGMADRIDLLVGAIGIGIEPSGSQDPYALRRAAGGLVKLIRAFEIEAPIKNLIQESVRLYGNRLKLKQDEIEKKLTGFLKERVFFELNLKPGSKPYEILSAVLAGTSVLESSLQEILIRFDQLKNLFERNREGFLKACKVIERTHNILKGIKGELKDHIDAGILNEDLEKELYEVVRTRAEEINSLAQEKKFYEVTERFGEYFFEPLNRFFDRVMVNVEDAKIRANRQALMKKINRLYTVEVADLSLITNQ